MFSKLLKHEWKANAGLLGILSLAALGAGLLGGGVLRAMIYIGEKMQEEDMMALGLTGLGMMLFFVVLALFAYALAVEFINLYRFYKNKFTDEGYLTFTLPVSAHQIFLSSFLNILAWMAISVVVVLVSASLIVLIGAGEHLTGDWSDLGEVLGFVRDEMASYPGYGGYQALMAVQTVLAPIYSVILIMSCVTVGSVLAKKHKILASIGLYYGSNMVINIATSVLTVVPSIVLLASMEDYEQNLYLYTNITTGITLALQLAVAVGGYFLSTGLMKHKLNLP